MNIIRTYSQETAFIPDAFTAANSGQHKTFPAMGSSRERTPVSSHKGLHVTCGTCELDMLHTNGKSDHRGALSRQCGARLGQRDVCTLTGKRWMVIRYHPEIAVWDNRQPLRNKSIAPALRELYLELHRKRPRLRFRLSTTSKGLGSKTSDTADASIWCNPTHQ